MKKYVRWTVITVSSPFILFIILCILIYIPPIQNFLVDTATKYASEATGMQISIGRIALRFPLDLVVKNTVIIDRQDTILNAEELTAKVQLMPLLKKKVELDGLKIENASMNTAGLIEGMQLKGRLGEFFIASHGVELDPELAIVNEATLKDTHLALILADTTAADTTESAPLFWKIKLQKVDIENVSFDMQMPLDTLAMNVAIGHAALRNGLVDLHQPTYSAMSFELNRGKFSMDTSNQPVAESGFDPSHIALTDMTFKADSLYYSPTNIYARIKDFNLKERSGLTIVSTQGQLVADSETLKVPTLKLSTNDSYMELSATMDWDATDINKDGTIQARLMADIGKNDILKVIPDLPEELVQKYPSVPLQIRAGMDGNLRNIQLTQFTLALPGVFRSHADGSIAWPLDSLRRGGSFNMVLETGDLSFLKDMTGGITIPQNMQLDGSVDIQASHFSADMALATATEGKVGLIADYDINNDSYQADIEVAHLNIHDFMPSDSIFHVSASLKAQGQGFDFFSPETVAKVEGEVSELQYASYNLKGVKLMADLQKSQAKATLNVNNTLIDLASELDVTLHPELIKATMNANVDKIDLHAMHIVENDLTPSMQFVARASTNMKDTHSALASVRNIHLKVGEKSFQTKDLNAGFSMSPDSVRSFVNAGDLYFLFRSMNSLERLTTDATDFVTQLMQQWKEKSIDQPALKKILPNAHLKILSRSDNPIANYLAVKNIHYDRLNVDLQTSPETGLNGAAKLYGLRTDSLRLDTIYFVAAQDTSELNFKSGVKALANKWQEAFNISLNGFVGASEAQLGLQYLNDKNEKGVDFGVKAQLHKRGMSLHVTPYDPTFVYRKFKVNPDNYIWLGDNGRIHAKLTMYDGNLSGLSLYSTPDSLNQQDLTVALHKIDLAEIRRIVPYMPEIAGSLTAEAHYVQSATGMMVAADIGVDELAYEKQPIGSIDMNMVYLPKQTGEHTIDGYINLNDEEVMTLNGSYLAAKTPHGNDKIRADMNLHDFPLSLANAFIPDRMAVLGGKMNGEMSVSGSSSKPLLNGTVDFDKGTIDVPMFSVNLRMDEEPVKVENSRLLFQKYKIFTKGNSPFTIDGYVDVGDLAAMSMNLKMNAQNFEFINAKQTKESVIHGKIYVDFFSIVKGTMDNLTIRGNMNILGNSDFTYILTDSPLTVEDRLNETVTFVNFSDTTQTEKKDIPAMTLGGMDILMTIHIDDAVQARVDLNQDGSNYMLLEGGGDLSFQYQPDGNMLLNGRYALMSGELKYQMPIIPLKTFHIQEGSYIEWTGNVMNPLLNIKAAERVRASVTSDDNSSRTVNFDVGVNLTNRLENLGFTFTLEAPDDGAMQNELAAKSAEEKNKLAVTMLVTGLYISDTSGTKGLSANSMLNSMLQSEINKIAGSALQSIDVNFGMESNDGSDGRTGTDYNIQFTKRFWNNRFQVVIGGTISTGNDAQQQENEAFIDNIALEYRLDNSGTRYIKLFHNKNYESILDGEVIETGAGIVLRKKVSRLGELFIFKKKKKNQQPEPESPNQQTESGRQVDGQQSLGAETDNQTTTPEKKQEEEKAITPAINREATENKDDNDGKK